MKQVLLVLCPILIAAVDTDSPDAQDDASAKLTLLRSQYLELREDMFSAREKFEALYADELKKLEAKAVESGDLKLVVEVREEFNSFRQLRPTSERSENPALARLQKVFADQSASIDDDLDRNLANLEQGYRKQLRDLRVELTKAGEIESALQVETELERLGRPRGQFVRVFLPKRMWLQLAEVEVFSHGRNVALKGVASQSSTASDGKIAWAASLAIDGNTNGDHAAGSTTHTKGTLNPWWEVDLGSEKTISRIVLWNRTDGNLQSRLDGFQLSVLDAKRETVWEKTFPKAPRRELTVDFEELANLEQDG